MVYRLYGNDDVLVFFQFYQSFFNFFRLLRLIKFVIGILIYNFDQGFILIISSWIQLNMGFI